MIIDLNKQRVNSEFIELFIVHEGYFTTYSESVTFRDNTPPYTLRTYSPLPIEFTGMEQKSDGAYARPKLIVANILDSFKDSVGVSTDDLIGKKLTRRRTLVKHLTSGSESSPPIEAPIDIFVIDRKESENAIAISFELATPFDLAGIQIPGRYIIPNTCSWVYQGAATDATYTRVGGCTWRVNSSNNGFPVYLDSRNNLFVNVSPPTHNQIASFTRDFIYAVAGNKTRINLDGSTTSVSRPEYFQAKITSSGPLSITNSRRCLRYTTYNAGTTYYTYKEGYLFNDYVLYNNYIWRCISTNVNEAPRNGPYWVRADVCGKKLSSCAARFASSAISVQFSNIPSTLDDQTKVLPYGGFPATKRYTR